jgi:putative DNA methylase
VTERVHSCEAALLNMATRRGPALQRRRSLAGSREPFPVPGVGLAYGRDVSGPEGIERRFDTAFVADLALREKQIQQVYRPVIAVHKWFARRPGSLFRALILAEFGAGSLAEDYYSGNRLDGVRVADPFMGGGTPIYEAARMGAAVVGCDINPMSFWIVREALTDIDLDAYALEADRVRAALGAAVGDLYQTRCMVCDQVADAKSYLWVKELSGCLDCGQPVRLYPGYLVAEDKRHPLNVLLCWCCEELVEVEDRKNPGECPHCRAGLRVDGPAKRGRCSCPNCGTVNKWPAGDEPPLHRMFAIEYRCARCKPTHAGRFFKRPDETDMLRTEKASDLLRASRSSFIPTDEIPDGKETHRLLKWGYRRYSDLFNDRQLVALGTLATLIADVEDPRVQDALATNFSDLLRYQNMLCRYDTMALKCLDVFSIHGFPAGLVQCEANILGVRNGSNNVGSGGWTNIVDKYFKAKTYCKDPSEVRRQGSKQIRVKTPGEYIGLSAELTRDDDPEASLRCGSSTNIALTPNSLDAVFTDPPYMGNVQYAELIDFCYVWLRRLVGHRHPVFSAKSTSHSSEVVANAVDGRGSEHFAEGLSSVFTRMGVALKPGAPLVFTYHHNDLDAYMPVMMGLLDAQLACTAVLSSPGEMGASIHISGTGSSIVDSVIVARKEPVDPDLLIIDDIRVAAKQDAADLVRGGVKVSIGDVRCIVYGQVTRRVVNHLRSCWDADLAIPAKLRLIQDAVNVTFEDDLVAVIREVHDAVAIGGAES